MALEWFYNIMICNSCVQQIYNQISNEELTILFYINGRETSVKESLKQMKNTSVNKMITLDNSIKTIKNRFNFKSYNINLYLFFLCRIEALNKIKKDHTWNYRIGTTGTALLSLLNKDEKRKAEIISNMKEN